MSKFYLLVKSTHESNTVILVDCVFFNIEYTKESDIDKLILNIYTEKEITDTINFNTDCTEEESNVKIIPIILRDKKLKLIKYLYSFTQENFNAFIALINQTEEDVHLDQDTASIVIYHETIDVEEEKLYELLPTMKECEVTNLWDLFQINESLSKLLSLPTKDVKEKLAKLLEKKCNVTEEEAKNKYTVVYLPQSLEKDQGLLTVCNAIMEVLPGITKNEVNDALKQAESESKETEPDTSINETSTNAVHSENMTTR